MADKLIVNKDGTVSRVPETAADITERTALATARSAAATKETNNATRLRTIAIKAAKYAKSQTNPALTAAEVAEAIARLALAASADDQ